MASGWDRAYARKLQDHAYGVATLPAPTTPMKLVPIVTINTPAESTAGTALASTTPPTIAMAAATNANPPVSANSASVSVTAGAAGTVAGVEVQDSAGTPVREAFGPLGTPRAVAVGDVLVFAVGAVAFQNAPTP